ncbi:hypothetical protein [Achromobacter xylosoxidans]|uniref:hypothetical protein n=1 Tax=Alcaligenes xylosoxydans xylosoxydans TaxID=85698 RepID=UPI003D2DB87B
MTTNHTPGPWSLETVRTSCGVCHKVGPFPGRREDDKPRHACLYADYPSESNPADQELLANARLIAAAPELLEAGEEAAGSLSAAMEIMTRLGYGRTANVMQAYHDALVAAISKAKGEQQ